MADIANREPIKEPTTDLKKPLFENLRELSVDEKILALCSKLRGDGFNKQADNLENKFVNYKSATTHLYRAIDEDGEDLIDAAHPDGEVDVENATGDLGTVETILTEKNKLTDIVNKLPTGKLSNIRLSGIRKTADGEVSLADAANQFKYMFEYIDKYILSHMKKDKTEQDKKYYPIAGAYHELATKIFTELNHPAVMLPEREVVQLVKNRLQGTIADHHASTINSIEDINKFVNVILNWLEDNNPGEKIVNSMLHNYVNKVQKLLEKKSFLGWDTVKLVFGDLTEKTEVLKNDLETLLNDKDANKFDKLVKQINFVISELDKLLIKTIPSIEQLLVQPEGKNKEIEDKKKSMEELQSVIISLKNTVVNAHNATENNALSKLYHTVIMSNFVSVKLSINELNKSLSKNIMMLEAMKSQSEVPVEKNTSSNTINLKQNELNKLQGWKVKLQSKNMDEANKQHITKWIDGQIADLNMADKPEQVSQIAEQNKRFEAKGLI